MASTSKNLVLLHGFMGSALNWGPIITRLKKSPKMEEWNLITPDLLGHGGRRGPEALSYNTLTLDLMSQDLQKQLSQALPNNEPFVALGHSFGLRPLLKLCSDPNWGPRISHLIVEDATPEITEENFKRLYSILERVPTPFNSREEARVTIETLFANDSRLAAFLFSNIRPMSAINSNEKVHDWRFDKKGLIEVLSESKDHPLWAEWENIPHKITLVYGENSDHVPASRLNRALERRSGKSIQSIQIPQSGHWIHSDQPEQFTDTLIKLLNP